MAQSWRLKVSEKDYTDKSNIETPIIGAIGIISPKGPKTFTRFNQGDTQGVLNTFGYPSKDYPMIQDALDIVQKCTMWIASPYKGGAYGGVFVTSKGTIPFNQGVSTKEISDYSAVNFTNLVGVGDSILQTFTYTIKDIDRYVAESLTLNVGGTAHAITITTSDTTETISDGEEGILDSGCTLDTSTGILTLVFKNALSDGTTISIGYTMDMSDTYFVLFDKNMQEDDLEVKVVKSEDVDGAFEITVARYNPVELEYIDVNGSPFLAGLSETSKDTYGSNIYIENIFGENQQLFDAHVINSEVDDFTNDTTMVKVAGGSRGTEVTATDVASVYDALQDTSKYQIKFCVDPTCSSDVATKYLELRNNYQKYCRFIYGCANVDGATIIESPTTYNYGITANRGMYQYCLHWGIHQDLYQGNDFLCSNMGLIAGCNYDAMNAGYAHVPAWLPDESNVSGILGSAITKLSKEGTSETVLEQLDNINFNAVVNDYNYGAMIVGWRTRQVKKTVYSNIPQSSLADELIDRIVKEVLPPRIGKIIDNSSYSLVTMGCNSILNQYAQYLEDYYVWCDDENNTPETKENEQLVVTVGLVYKNFSRTILLNFVAFRNSNVSVEERLKEY